MSRRMIAINGDVMVPHELIFLVTRDDADTKVYVKNKHADGEYDIYCVDDKDRRLWNEILWFGF